MKHFSLKVWCITSLFIAVGSTSLWITARVLRSVFTNDAYTWLLGNAGNFKRGLLSVATLVLAFYAIRAARAGTLWLESKSRKERL